MKKQLWAVLAMMLALMMCVPMAAGADEYLRVYEVNEETGEVGAETDSYIEQSGTYLAEGTSDGDNIKVANGADVTLILAGVEVVPHGSAALDCTEAGSLTLVLADNTENEFIGGKCYAGIQNAGVPLTIMCESVYDGEENHDCIEENCGFLYAQGGSFDIYGGAGIGGGMKQEQYESASEGENGRYADGKNITINGGYVVAQGAFGAAGIGGGNCYENIWRASKEIHHAGDASGIEITGGVVDAYGGEFAPGIGGAMHTRLLLVGDAVEDEDMSDYTGGSATDIEISGGWVTAIGKMAAGIGCAYKGDASGIVISGGNVYAELYQEMGMMSEGGDALAYAPVGNGLGRKGEKDDVVIEPKSGLCINVYGGGNEDQGDTGAQAAMLAADDGTSDEPFAKVTTYRDITSEINGMQWLMTMSEDVAVGAQPSTGDGMGVGFWAALLALSAAAFAAMKRRMA